MVRVVTDYLDQTAKEYPDKVAFIDEKRAITFSEFQNEAHHIAAKLIGNELFKQPILVYLEKSVEVVVAFEGITYSGNFYSPLDTHMPEERIAKIVEKLNPAAIVTDEAHREHAEKIIGKTGGVLFTYEECQNTTVDIDRIKATTERVIDSDVLYVLFTSGSTGTPKGVIISHKGIIDLSEWISRDLNFDENTIFGALARAANGDYGLAVFDSAVVQRH